MSSGYVSLVPNDFHPPQAASASASSPTSKSGETMAIVHRTASGLCIPYIHPAKRKLLASGEFKAVDLTSSLCGKEVAVARSLSSSGSFEAQAYIFNKESGLLALLSNEGPQEGIPNFHGTFSVYEQGTGESKNLVMDFYNGGTLRDAIQKGALRPADAKLILLKVAKAMAYAHSKGIIHQDIKGDNILLAKGPDGKVTDAVLADWGIAINLKRLTRGHGLTNFNFDILPWPMHIAANTIIGLATLRARAKQVNGPRHKAADVFAFGILCRSLIQNRPETAALLDSLIDVDYEVRPTAQGVVEALSRLPADTFAHRQSEKVSIAQIRQLEKVAMAPPKPPPGELLEDGGYTSGLWAGGGS